MKLRSPSLTRYVVVDLHPLDRMKTEGVAVMALSRLARA